MIDRLLVTILATAVLISACTATESSKQISLDPRWQHVTTTSRGDAYVDMDNFTQTPEGWSMWVRLHMTNQYGLSKYRVDCVTRRTIIDEVRVFSYDNKLVEQGTPEGGWMEPSPGSIDELLMRRACSLNEALPELYRAPYQPDREE